MSVGTPLPGSPQDALQEMLCRGLGIDCSRQQGKAPGGGDGAWSAGLTSDQGTPGGQHGGQEAEMMLEVRVCRTQISRRGLDEHISHSPSLSLPAQNPLQGGSGCSHHIPRAATIRSPRGSPSTY